MRVDGHVPSRSSQALVLPVRDVFFGLGVDVFFGQAKVNDVDNMLLFIPLTSDEKVFGLHVPVDEVFGVHVLHP